jgi:hypothetical protein
LQAVHGDVEGSDVAAFVDVVYVDSDEVTEQLKAVNGMPDRTKPYWFEKYLNRCLSITPAFRNAGELFFMFSFSSSFLSVLFCFVHLLTLDAASFSFRPYLSDDDYTIQLPLYTVQTSSSAMGSRT